jgi:cell division protein FtsQ
MIRKKKNKGTRGERLDRGRRQPSIYSRTGQTKEEQDFSRKILLSLLGVILVGLFYLLFLSPVFRINSIEIVGTQYLNKGNIAQIAGNYKASSILEKNTVTFSSGGLEKKVDAMSGVMDATVTKKYPNTILVQIKERKPDFVWQTLNSKYLVDETGYIYAGYSSQFASLPIVVDTENLPTAVGKQPASSEFGDFVSQINSEFESKTNEKITRMEVAGTTSELKVYTSSWYAYFDTTRSASDELSDLNRVLNKVAGEGKGLKYVDLRVDGKIFYMLTS